MLTNASTMIPISSKALCPAHPDRGQEDLEDEDLSRLSWVRALGSRLRDGAVERKVRETRHGHLRPVEGVQAGATRLSPVHGSVWYQYVLGMSSQRLRTFAKLYQPKSEAGVQTRRLG